MPNPPCTYTDTRRLEGGVRVFKPRRCAAPVCPSAAAPSCPAAERRAANMSKLYVTLERQSGSASVTRYCTK
ncbi:hypothetical protein CesoFtcFv8_021342 [Champsocephalus esox]|uniref:Uncharacterized protein n=1 Tax=Champsocephalus esox TaxID=159716 RepID=A0AAN8BCR1_9TELE|nr:hypothetical protein CesoFtcFv8_021342 [Champsocephalus esox]